MKLFFGIAVILVMGLLGFKVIPLYFANYEFEDAIKNDAVQATYSSRTEQDIRAAVVKHAHEYDIPLTPQQVRVSRVGGFGTGTLTIDAEYSVPLDLPGYSMTLQFHPSSSNKGVF